MIIETQEELDSFCHQLANQSYLTIDTEFLRDKTYFPKLCLIQMSGPDVPPAAIDPIDHDLDWTPIYDLLVNENVMKVFHAARQDLEIFYHLTGTIPHPIFDTQVASMVCGYGDSIAYHALVKNITGHVLEKSAQFTDWARRPLSKKQLAYALDDVLYLREVYEHLDQTLAERGREKWVKAEMAILTSPDTYVTHPETAWQRIKIRTDKPEVLAVLQALAAWREEQAVERNVPRGRILRDEALVDLALYMPKKIDGLLRIRNVPTELAKGRVGGMLLDVIATARAQPEESWPLPKKRNPFPKTAQPILEMLKMLLKINCAESDVATKLVASSDDLQKIAVDDSPDIPCMKGWRYDVFGQDALKIKNGRLGLSIQDGEIKRIQI